MFPTVVFALDSFAAVSSARANLVSDGQFTAITYSGTQPLTTYFGQFGNNSGATTGSQLAVGSWDTAGYNFVYAPNTADSGTSANGANSGQPNEAPGQYNTSAGYGSTYLYGTNNGGTTAITAVPGGGNFVAADGVFQTGAITQSINSLQVGKSYALTFSWAGAQQQGFTGATTENWTVSLGTQSFTTSSVMTPAQGFSGWMQQTFTYTATATTETLSFLAGGTPMGQPPFSLLGNVDLEMVPEFSHWAVFASFGLLVAGGSCRGSLFTWLTRRKPGWPRGFDPPQ